MSTDSNSRSPYEYVIGEMKKVEVQWVLAKKIKNSGLTGELRIVVLWENKGKWFLLV